MTTAEIGYDRWYIAGHSLGSVIALKGLMYSDRAFAKMLNFNAGFIVIGKLVLVG